MVICYVAYVLYIVEYFVVVDNVSRCCDAFCVVYVLKCRPSVIAVIKSFVDVVCFVVVNFFVKSGLQVFIFCPVRIVFSVFCSYVKSMYVLFSIY